MALITSSPVAYDCGSCGKPVWPSPDGWKHIDRHAEHAIDSVTEVVLFP